MSETVPEIKTEGSAVTPQDPSMISTPGTKTSNQLPLNAKFKAAKDQSYQQQSDGALLGKEQNSNDTIIDEATVAPSQSKPDREIRKISKSTDELVLTTSVIHGIIDHRDGRDIAKTIGVSTTVETEKKAVTIDKSIHDKDKEISLKVEGKAKETGSKGNETIVKDNKSNDKESEG